MTLSETRLRNERAELEEFTRRTPWLKIKSAEGNPPRTYELIFTCRSVVRIDGGRATLGRDHVLKVVLPANFPFEKPIVHVLTPISNPHVFTSGLVCLGNSRWKPNENLALFSDRLRRILICDPSVLDRGSAANPAAMAWAVAHMDELPLDLLEPPAPPKRKIGPFSPI